MTSRIFITGTDTGIGKTVLTGLILEHLQAAGIHAAPMKPVQTGCFQREGEWVAPDLEWSLDWCGQKASSAERAQMAPYRYEPACSPHLAAEMAGERIQIPMILKAADALSDRYDTLVIEGAGGIMVPLNREEMMLDLMVRLGAPVILATRPALGTLNHTLLSVARLREAGLPPLAAVVIESGPPEHDFIEEDNLKTLKEQCGIPVLGPIPYLEGLAPDSPDRERFSRQALALLEPLKDLL